MVEQKIFNRFQQMIETTMVIGDLFAEPIASAAESMSKSLLSGGSIYACGEQSGTIISALLCDYLSNGFEIERPGFPALHLNPLCLGNIRGDRYAMLLKTHGRNTDTLFLASCGHSDPAVLAGLSMAIEKDMSVILFTIDNDDPLIAKLRYHDTHVDLNNLTGQLTTLAQVEIIQCICFLIDEKIFGGS